MKIHATAPHFCIRDLHTSVRFYVDVLGFEEPELWGEPPSFAMPRRDGFVVMLNQTDEEWVRPNGVRGVWDAYFWCDAVDDFFDRIKDRAEVFHGPEDRQLYGMREIAVKDPDGYLLVFAEDLEKPG